MIVLLAATALGGAWRPVGGPWAPAPVDAVDAETDSHVHVLAGGKLWTGGLQGFEHVEAFAPLDGALTRSVSPGPVVWETTSTRICRWHAGERACQEVAEFFPQAVRVAADGSAWTGGLWGAVMRWSPVDRRWTPIEDVLLPSTTAGHVVGVRPVSYDEAWIAVRSRLVHFDGGAFSARDLPDSGATQTVAADLCIGANPVWVAHDASIGRDDWDEVPIECELVSCGVADQGAVWLGAEDGRVWSVDGETVEQVPSGGSGRVHHLHGDWAASGSLLLHYDDGANMAFRDVAETSGLDDPGPGIAARFIDANGDRRPDLVLVRSPGDVRLLLQSTDGTFLDGTVGSGLAGMRWTRPRFASCDLDRDGREDLLVADVDGVRATITYLRQRPLGGFADVTERSGLTASGDIQASDVAGLLCEDLDEDGAADVLLAVRTGIGGLPTADWLWHNRGYGKLTPVRGAARGIGGGGDWAGPPLTMELLDSPGRELIKLSAWRGHRVYARGQRGRWHDRTASTGLRMSYGTPMGAAAGDLDQDGDEDLVVVDRSMVRWFRNDGGRLVDRTDPDSVVASEAAWSFGPVGEALRDLDGDGDLDLVHHGGATGPRLLRQTRPFHFVDESARLGLHTTVAVGLATADVDGDGDLDLYVVRDRAANQLWLDDRVRRRPAPVAALPWANPLARRIQWLYPQETAVRGLVVLGGIGALFAFGRRRSLWWTPRLALGAIPLVLAVELGTEDLEALARWGALGGWAVGLFAIGLFDLRRTRWLRATRVMHYRLEAELGAGGMGTVWKAWDSNAGRRVALKLMHPDLDDVPLARERFRREAEVGARLEHRNLVRVYEHGECTVYTGDASRRTAYLAMEHVQGSTLRRWLRGRGPLPPGLASRLLVDVLAGVGALHDANIVHRDLKPENVLITGDGEVKVADYGLARGGSEHTLTRTGDLMGTIAYMPPEYARGRDNVDERGDVYAVGVMAWELLAGRLPFEGTETLEVMYRVLHDTPSHLDRVRTDLPPGLADVVATAMNREPTVRYGSAAAFADALRPFVEGEQVAPPVTTTEAQAEILTEDLR